MNAESTDGPARDRLNWLSWVLGGALLVAVIVAAFRFSEEQAFVRLLERAEPWWLALAVGLQAGTYLAQGGIWRLVAHASAYRMSRRTAFTLSLVKLFADQALPSAGLSSSILIAKALERHRMPAGAIKASVLINLTSYHVAYAIALVVALGIVAARGQINTVIAATSGLFLLFSLGLSTGVLGLAGRPHERIARKLHRLPVVRTTLTFLAGADRGLVRNPRMLADAIALQGVIVGLDAATLWVLLAAVGAHATAGGVFASFMVASLFRTMGIVPGGLGTFEVTSVLMLRLVGVELAEALAATLLFRGLTFWLPMLPGYWFSRRATVERWA